MLEDQIKSIAEKNRKAMTCDLCDLIKIRSERGEAAPGKPFGSGPAMALSAALKKASDMGLYTKNYDSYVGAVDYDEKLPACLDILAHLDVVPAGDDWNVTKPFEPLIVDGRLYGRGTADDKGPAVAALYAVKTVRELGIPLKKNVRLILGTNEECGSSDISHYYEIEKEAPMTFSPDAEFPVINIEKGGLRSAFTAGFTENATLPKIISIDGGTKLNVVPGTANAVAAGFTIPQLEGYCAKAEKLTGVSFTCEQQNSAVLIKAKGASAHASTPEKGNNPITALLYLLASMPFNRSEGFKKLCAVNSLFPHNDWDGKAAGIAMSDKESGKLTISLDILHYTEKGFEGAFDCRAPLCATDENVRNVLTKKLESSGIKTDGKKMFAAHYVPADTPFVNELLKCYEQYTGNKGYCVAIGGGTYVHELKNGVAFGCTMPGSDQNMHGADEFAYIDDLVKSTEIFAQVIVDLCS